MKFFGSNQGHKPSKEATKRGQMPAIKPADSLYARLRRLEQKLDTIEVKVSTLQRDTWRIEKKQTASVSPPEVEPVKEKPGFPARLFDY